MAASQTVAHQSQELAKREVEGTGRDWNKLFGLWLCSNGQDIQEFEKVEISKRWKGIKERENIKLFKNL